MIKKNTESIFSVKLVLFIYIVCCIISYFYVINEGSYNGDLMGVQSKSSGFKLLIYLIYAILPFIFNLIIFKIFSGIIGYHRVTINVDIYRICFLFILIIQIFLAVTTGTGKMGQENYASYINNTPPVIRIINMIFNRFDVNWGISLYLLNVKKGDKLKAIIILLAIGLNLYRLSMGILAYLPMLFILSQDKNNIIHIIKKWFLLILIVVSLLIVAVPKLYDFRTIIRGGQPYMSRVALGEIIFGKLVGRLSSYSHSAYLVERGDSLESIANRLSPWRYIMDALFIPQPKGTIGFGHVVLVASGRSPDYGVTPGIPGILVTSYYNSFESLIITMLTYISIVLMPFLLSSLLNCKRIKGLVFLNLCMASISGGGYEISRISIIILSYMILFLCINFFVRWIPVKA